MCRCVNGVQRNTVKLVILAKRRRMPKVQSVSWRMVWAWYGCVVADCVCCERDGVP
jgi:hypothetical protein